VSLAAKAKKDCEEPESEVEASKDAIATTNADGKDRFPGNMSWFLELQKNDVRFQQFGATIVHVSIKLQQCYSKFVSRSENRIFKL
jgi:hypothetical protein